MSIESITLKEFQCHHKLTIEFDPLVTVLIGESDSGKSAVIRSIRWLATNRPSGDGIVRRGGGTDAGRSASVALRVDGRSVKRVRGPGRNLFILDGDKLKSFGAGVPEPVERLLNLGPINIAGQHQAPHLFSLSPGEVARELNSVVNLAEIDRVQVRLAAELRKARATTEVYTARLAETRSCRDSLAWVQDAAKVYSTVEARFATVDSLREHVRGVTHLLERSQALSEIFRVAGEALPVLNRVLKLGEGVQALRQRVASLETLMKQADETQKVIQRSNDEADSLSARMAKVRRCPVCGSPKKL